VESRDALKRICSNPSRVAHDFVGSNPPTLPARSLICLPWQAPKIKYFCFSEMQITVTIPSSHPARGAARDRHERAVGCGGRGVRNRRGRARRMAKSCGPDAPMAGVKLLGSSRFLGATVTNKPWSRRGEHGISRHTIAQGRPDASAEPVCSCALFVCYLCTRDRGCSAHPVFPAPLLGSRRALSCFGRNEFAKLGQMLSREGGDVPDGERSSLPSPGGGGSAHIERSEM
jgi:hypothetical protein